MDTLLQDLRFAYRSLRRSPGFSLTVIAVMALGIGANALVFTLVRGVMMQALPFPEPDRIVRLEATSPKWGEGNGASMSPLDIADVTESARQLSATAGFLESDLSMALDKDAQRFHATLATSQLATVLGVQPVLGRWFTPQECTPDGRLQFVILSGRIWREQFASDPAILGRALRMNGRVRTVVGVMPENFRFPQESDVFLPLALNDGSAGRGARYYGAVARLRPGVQLAQADAELGAISADLAKRYPDTNTDIRLRPVLYHEALVRSYRPMLLMLSLAVGFVLLIVCANVANLLLARSTTRTREIGVRLAMGASRGRLIRQMLTESLFLAVIGGIAGVVLAEWGLRLTLAAIPVEMPFWLKFSLDRTVLVYTLLLATISGVVFGLVPALEATRGDILTPLRDGSAASGDAPSRRRLRDALVVAEIALAVVLLVGAGLMVRSFASMAGQRTTLGAGNVLTGSIGLPFATYPEASQRLAFFRDLRERIGALPGVRQVGFVNNLHLGSNRWNLTIQREGVDAEADEGRSWPSVGYNIISPGYLEAIGLPVVRGRGFTDADRSGSQRVALVNEAAASQLWPGADPIGKRFRTAATDTLGWATVVGVIPTVRQNVTADAKYVSEFLFPMEQSPLKGASMAIQASGDLGALARQIRRMLRERDPELVFDQARSLDEHVRYAMWEIRLYAQLLGTFSTLALLIAALGIYGVMAFSVARRTREIGIRMALGAARHDVQRMVVGQALRLTLLGMGIGVVLAYALTRFMANQLFEVRPDDPPTFAGVTLILTASALLAAWLPAARATRVDPMVALRHD